MGAPTLNDDHKVVRMYQYTHATKDYGMIIAPTSLDIHAFIDASFAVHWNKKSHTGIIVSIGFGL
jgi:hypothetical protein